MAAMDKPVIFTAHALEKMMDRGATEANVLEAIQKGYRKPAKRGLWQYRLDLPFNGTWMGRLYSVQQVAPIVDDEKDRYVVITVYVFYFQEGLKDENKI